MTSDTVGASPPPPGVTPNFDNPESIAYRVILASLLGPIIAIPICLVRLYTKRYILRLVTNDDCESLSIQQFLSWLIIAVDCITLATVCMNYHICPCLPMFAAHFMIAICLGIFNFVPHS